MEWVTATDIERETWRRLLEYANVDLTINALALYHGVPRTRSDRSNYRKQATQIRVAMLQAREYFSSVETASLITAPNPLYYGAYSLASAIMLLRGGGTFSFDHLRRDAKHASHGLSFTTGVSASSAPTGLTLLESSWVEIRPSGHFINWYSTLPSGEATCALIRQPNPGGGYNTFMAEHGGQPCRSPDEIGGTKVNLLGLAQIIPDLSMDLRRYRSGIPSTRCNFDVTQDEFRRVNLWEWRLHGAGTPTDLQEILEGFRVPYSLVDHMSSNVADNGTACTVRMRRVETHHIFYFPSIRMTTTGEQFMYAKELDTQEIADQYRLSYGLSMLARYFPDLWVSCLDSHGLASKVVERAVSVLHAKLPVLALSMLLNQVVVISPHRPPWFA